MRFPRVGTAVCSFDKQWDKAGPNDSCPTLQRTKHTPGTHPANGMSIHIVGEINARAHVPTAHCTLCMLLGVSTAAVYEENLQSSGGAVVEMSCPPGVPKKKSAHPPKQILQIPPSCAVSTPATARQRFPSYKAARFLPRNLSPTITRPSLGLLYI